MKPICICWLIVAGLAFQASAQEYTVSGYVLDEATGEVLVGANLYNITAQNGTTTNSYGFFSYTAAGDSIDLRVSYVGFHTERIRMNLDRDTTLNIELRHSAELDEIVVTADLFLEEMTQMSIVTLPVEQIKTMPHLLGEVDLLKAVQMMPGVQSGAEGTSGLYVRGGGPDQNLILIDGVPVYNVSHLFGFISIFNADAVNNVRLIKGGFPPMYGGRLSSVLDITLKEGNREKLKGAGSVGLISAKFTADGPLSDNTTFLLSGRRSYIDLLARPFINAQSGGEESAGYYLYDLNARINHRISDRDRLYLSGYTGRDRAYSEGAGGAGVGMHWGNVTSALRWNHLYNPKLFGNVTLTYSRYLFDIRDTGVEGGSFYYSGIDDFAARADFDYAPSPRHNVTFGATAIRHRFNPGATDFTSPSDADLSWREGLTYATEFFAYAGDDFSLTDRLKLNGGLHYSGFNVDNRLYTSLQPRIAFNYMLPHRIALKGSYTRMTQYIHLLTNSGIGLPTDLWVPATGSVEPQRANQVALGLARTIDRFEISLEGYYKSMRNLITYRDGAGYLEADGNWQEKVVSGRGESYGMELFVQKNRGRWNGWFGYTLAWNNRQFDEVNFGNPFPYKYDRRHDINLVLNYAPREGLQYSLGWVYGTGNAVTVPTHRYRGETNEPQGFRTVHTIEHFEGRNDYRMPAYHRLDLSIAWTKQKRWGERTWTLGLYNAYSRRNPFFLDIQKRSDSSHFVQYSLFPILPSATYSFTF